MYPTNKKASFAEPPEKLQESADCNTAMEGLQELDAPNYARNVDLIYPQNSLRKRFKRESLYFKNFSTSFEPFIRNLAKTYINTLLFFLVDIDIVPSVDLRHQFNKFAKKVRLKLNIGF